MKAIQIFVIFIEFSFVACIFLALVNGIVSWYRGIRARLWFFNTEKHLCRYKGFDKLKLFIKILFDL